MAKFFASKESRLARSGNGLAAGYGTLLPSYWYANVHLFPRVLEKDGHLLPPFLSLSLSLSIFFLRSIRQRLPAIFNRDKENDRFDVTVYLKRENVGSVNYYWIQPRLHISL